MRIRLVLVAALAVPGLTGCSRFISEGKGAVTGASGQFVDIQSIGGETALSEFGRIEFEPVMSDVGDVVPPLVLTSIRQETLERLAEKGYFTGPGPVLTLSGRVTHYEKGGGADAALDPLQQVIMRVEARDGATLLGIANVTGRSTSLSSSGRRNLAKGCAKGIVKWLKQYTPSDKQ